jgi:hypothetical protein
MIQATESVGLEGRPDSPDGVRDPYLLTGDIMNAQPSQPAPDAAPTPDATALPVDPSLSGSSPTRAARRIPLGLLTLGVGLVSGLISWAGGEWAFTRFRGEHEMIYPPNYQQVGGYEKQALTANITGAAQRAAERKKAATSFGLLGLVLGVGLGLVGGWVSGSSRSAGVGVLGGGLAGAAAGAGLSWAAVPLFYRYLDPEVGLFVLFITHAAIFSGVGAAAGLALGLGLGDRPAMVQALFGGLIGGLIGTVALETINSIAFPLMRTFEPLASEQTPRLSMYLCVAVGIALFAGIAAGRPGRRPRVASD